MSWFFARYRPCRGVAFTIPALCLIGAMTGQPEPARAQGWGFLGGFFGAPARQPPPPQDDRYYAPRRKHQVSRPREREPDAREAEKPAAPKTDAAHDVVVLGDSLGQLLANGLDDALSDRPDVAVLHKARDSSGLVREDFYNWPKAVAEILAEKPVGPGKIDVAVIMIGSNDRQGITENGKTYPSDSDEWTAIYTKRAMAIAEACKAKHIPLIWVGVPITKSDSFADDMAALNDIYRDVAAKTGATFVDTWEAFSDANGDFSAFGPDVNGQNTRLRASDGIHFTKAGSRKLAHFVEVVIRHALDQTKPVDPAGVTLVSPDPRTPATSSPETAKLEPAKLEEARQDATPKPDAGPVEVLTRSPSPMNGRLDFPVSHRDDRGDALLNATLVKGEAQAATPGVRTMRPGRRHADDATHDDVGAAFVTLP